MSESVEGLTKRVEVLEKSAIRQGEQILRLANALEKSVEQNERQAKNMNKLLDMIGIPG